MNVNVMGSEPEVNEELPWLVFKLHDLAYTINSRIVNGILQYPEIVTPVTSAPAVFRGIMNSRGGILPLLDMRALFNMKSNQEDYNAFVELVNTIKKEFDEHFASLMNSVSNWDTVDFKQAAPCFSKWRFQAVRHKNKESSDYKDLPFSLLEQTDEYMRRGEELSLVVGSAGETEEALKTSEPYIKFKAAKDDIHALLSDALEVYQEKYKEIIVTVSDGKSLLGLIVDEVVAVEFLDILSDEESFPKFQRSKFFCGVAVSTRVHGEILIINEDLLLQMASEFDN
ncbi:MAG: chemotaxis protein CheW [Oscillospiraceae bacterium]|nr:chemotaxis protein CheW [Oscillospiraceae bacterium]